MSGHSLEIARDENDQIVWRLEHPEECHADQLGCPVALAVGSLSIPTDLVDVGHHDVSLGELGALVIDPPLVPPSAEPVRPSAMPPSVP